MENNMKKNMYYMHVYVCAYLNHTAIHQQLTQRCKSTMLQLKKINGQLFNQSKQSCLSCEAFIKTQPGVLQGT